MKSQSVSPGLPLGRSAPNSYSLPGWPRAKQRRSAFPMQPFHLAQVYTRDRCAGAGLETMMKCVGSTAVAFMCRSTSTRPADVCVLGGEEATFATPRMRIQARSSCHELEDDSMSNRVRIKLMAVHQKPGAGYKTGHEEGKRIPRCEGTPYSSGPSP